MTIGIFIGILIELVIGGVIFIFILNRILRDMFKQIK